MNKDNLIVVNLSQIELPVMTEVRNNVDWVKFGENNDWPLKLQDYANRSALHNAIISGKVDHICGEGLTYEKNKDKKTDNFLMYANPNETMDEVFRKLVYDYVLYGGYALNVIWSKDRKSIAEVYHIDFAKIRSGKKNEKEMVTEYYYSKDWKNYRKSENTPIVIPAFDVKSKEASQLIYYFDYRPGLDYYPLPSYVGAMSYIEIDVEISNFHLAHIKNGMSPNVMISFVNGIPTEEERKKIEKQIKEKYGTTDNAGKFILTFSDDSTRVPQVTTLTPSQLDKQFLQLQDTVLQNILSGHKVTSPMLVGIKEAGQLGGNNEILTSWELYFNNVITPMQQAVLKTMNKIGAINGTQELDINNKQPIKNSWSEGVLANILTRNELREVAGYEPIEEPVIPEVTTEQMFAPKFIDINSDLSTLKPTDLEKYYMWVLDDDDACPTCIEHSEQGAMKLKDWMKRALPGIPTGFSTPVGDTDYATEPFGTFCEENCRCRLVKVTDKTANIK